MKYKIQIIYTNGKRTTFRSKDGGFVVKNLSSNYVVKCQDKALAIVPISQVRVILWK